MKEVAERLPEGLIVSSSTDLNAGHTNQFSNHLASETTMTTITASERESNSNSMNPNSPNGSKAQTGKAEWVVQDEPGVYVTLSSLPGGGNELKRVRFRYVHVATLLYYRYKRIQQVKQRLLY